MRRFSSKIFFWLDLLYGLWSNFLTIPSPSLFLEIKSLINLIVSSLTLFPLRSSAYKFLFKFNPFNIAFPPALPSLFHLKSIYCRVWFYFKQLAINIPASGPISLFLTSTLLNDLFSPIAENKFYRPVSDDPILFHSSDIVFKVYVYLIALAKYVAPVPLILFPLSSTSVIDEYFNRNFDTIWHPSSPIYWSMRDKTVEFLWASSFYSNLWMLVYFYEESI